MFASNKSAAPSGKLFVEDVFSTYLYTGNGSTQTITNGIDLAGKGGLVWLKSRSGSGYNHVLTDTARGVNATLVSNNTAAQFTAPTLNWAFLSSGFSINNNFTDWNTNGATYASWTFREAPKFFDVVTYTGTGSFFRDLSHSLGVAPGFIVVKRTDTTSNWWTYHRGVLGSINGYLNLTNAFNNIGYVDPSPTPAATFRVFNTGAGDDLNVSGATYVAYLYAHDATTDGVIQCGSFTTDGSGNATVNLGWEPQWAMVKASSGVGDWWMNDVMRAWDNGGIRNLYANTATAESGYIATSANKPTASGFTFSSNANTTYIYIAIRRGPMRTPTLGTSVFSPIRSTRAAGGTNTTGFPVDMQILGDTSQIDSNNWTVVDRLRKVSTTPDDNSSPGLKTSATSAEATGNASKNWSSTGFETPFFFPSVPAIYYSFRRAPGFFDEVCYTGNGVQGRTIPHNLGVAPELMIFKTRGNTNIWCVYHASLGASALLRLAGTNASDTPHPFINYTAPTSTVVTVGGDFNTNHTGLGQVAYLFASCPGVSKVGSYTGNGSSQTINCGFAAGARFVMIKRTDSTGDWYVWDTARGIVAANDPHLSLNTTAAEVTTDDTIDTNSSGFVVNQDAATNVNVNAATYIFLAIA